MLKVHQFIITFCTANLTLEYWLYKIYWSIYCIVIITWLLEAFVRLLKWDSCMTVKAVFAICFDWVVCFSLHRSIKMTDYRIRMNHLGCLCLQFFFFLCVDRFLWKCLSCIWISTIVYFQYEITLLCLTLLLYITVGALWHCSNSCKNLPISNIFNWSLLYIDVKYKYFILCKYG